MGTKKIGRPTESPKSHNTRIRLSDEDLAKLNYCKSETGMTYADIIRKGIDKIYQEVKK